MIRLLEKSRDLIGRQYDFRRVRLRREKPYAGTILENGLEVNRISVRIHTLTHVNDARGWKECRMNNGRWIRRFAAAAVVLLFVGKSFCTQTAASDVKRDVGKNGKPDITFGLYSSVSNKETDQFINIVKDCKNEVGKMAGVTAGVKVFGSSEELFAASLKSGLDYVMFFNIDKAAELIKQNRYKPLFAYSYYGNQRERRCVFSKADKPGALKDLKNVRVHIDPTLFDYAIYRKMMGPGADNAITLVSYPDPGSAFYALALDEVDYIFASELFYHYLKTSNPGPLKGVKMITCSADYPSPPFLASVNASGELSSKIADYFIRYRKLGLFKKYWPLMDITKLRFYPVTAEDYKPVINLLDEAKTNGVEKEYKLWRKYMKTK